jgi:hypothetical protein
MSKSDGGAAWAGFGGKEKALFAVNRACHPYKRSEVDRREARKICEGRGTKVRDCGGFEGAREGSLSAAGPNQARLRIPNSSMHNEVDRLNSLKPWVFF